MLDPFPALPPAKGVPPPAAAAPHNTATSNQTYLATATYSAVAAKTPYLTPRLKPVPLGSRPATHVDNTPAILLTQAEEEQLRKQRENTLIMKFAAGHPTLYDIRSLIHSEWKLEYPPAVGVLDKHHITIHLGSSSDTKRALACKTNKVKSSYFRLFRWTADFEVGRESSFTAVWVKMHNIPLHYFNESAVHRLGSLIGTVLSIHPSTLNLTQQAYAKVCVELDVSKPFMESVWIGTSKEYGWSIDLEYEGNHAYCDYCGILGHTMGLCKKKREDNGKTKTSRGKEKLQEETWVKGTKEQWVPKQTGMGTQDESRQHDPLVDSMIGVVSSDIQAQVTKAQVGASQTLIREGREAPNGDTHNPNMEAEPENVPNNNTLVQILQRPRNGVTTESHKALVAAGLVSTSPSMSQSVQQHQNKAGDVITSQHIEAQPSRSPTRDEEIAAILSANNVNDRVEEDLRRNETLTLQDETGLLLNVVAGASEINRDIAQSSMTMQFKNKFFILDTEEELQQAFENLHSSTPKSVGKNPRDPQNTNLQPETEVLATSLEYFSDGTGTQDKSNRGVPFTNSAPNSDAEQDRNTAVGSCKRKTKQISGTIRRSTRVSKEKVQFTP